MIIGVTPGNRLFFFQIFQYFSFCFFVFCFVLCNGNSECEANDNTVARSYITGGGAGKERDCNVRTIYLEIILQDDCPLRFFL